MAESTPTTSRKRFPYRMQFEPRLDTPPGWFPAAVSLGAVVVALILGGIIIALVGGDPFATYAHIAEASFGEYRRAFGYPGQGHPDSVHGPGLFGRLPHEAVEYRRGRTVHHGRIWRQRSGADPGLACRHLAWIFIPVMMLAGMVAGALWGFIPGFLKARFNVNEIISSLMLNYIAISWMNFWIFGVWSEGGFQMSPKFPETPGCRACSIWRTAFPIFRGLTTHLGLLIGIVAAVILWFVIYRSRGAMKSA